MRDYRVLLPGLLAIFTAIPDLAAQDDGHCDGSPPVADGSSGAAVIVCAESGDWVALSGNGDDSSGETAALVVADPADGEVLRVLDTGVGGDNGLAAPAAVDRDRNGAVDRVYAGDLKGNLWKFDLSADEPGDWVIGYGGDPLFTAVDSGGRPQPVTARPDALRSPHGGLMVVFGTGKCLAASDPGDTATQSVYGIWDVEGAAGEDGMPLADTPVGGLDDLQRQHVVIDASLGDTEVRVLSREPVDYRGENARRGWVFDLSRAGERIVQDVRIFDGKALLVSSIPGDDSCTSGGRSALIEIDPLTGTQFDGPLLDLNRDGRFDGGDGIVEDGAAGGQVYPALVMVDIEVGLATVPEILIREDGNHEIRITGSGSATRTIGERSFFRPGRASWQQRR